MDIPENAADLVELAIKSSDAYIAAAVHKVASESDKVKLESLMFGKRRNALMLAKWEYTPASVLLALSNSTDGAVVVRLAKTQAPLLRL